MFCSRYIHYVGKELCSVKIKRYPGEFIRERDSSVWGVMERINLGEKSHNLNNKQRDVNRSEDNGQNNDGRSET